MCGNVEDGVDPILIKCSFARVLWVLSHIPRKWVARDDLNMEACLWRAHRELDWEEFVDFFFKFLQVWIRIMKSPTDTPNFYRLFLWF
ncbi:UNVERIFIED_CONTAM: hypothetical protein Sangu_3066200 [Sesamum angustifolium]|uniref:Reverse transcriptase zinc-binding domain-containing protein n=1 Tax=Sesamum angustifolium TaxID=2727405 RepID=A0AAW2KD27_9LAMI